MVLVGGSSRRMGRDKATMPCPGTPHLTMVEHTVAVLGSRCDPVLVVAAPGQRLPVLDAVVLRDDVPSSGPLSATACGLRAAAAAGARWAFVSAVDMPYLTVKLVDDLARVCAVDPAVDIALPFDGRDHFLAGVYRTALASRIEALLAAGRCSMRSLVETVVAERVRLAPGARVLTNLNAPDDAPIT